MSLLPRRAETATNAADRFAGDVVPTGIDVDAVALRDEADPDPLVEEAVERLRGALTSLVARDEWGRPLAWRQIARIAIGPLLTQLRDAQTASQLLDATRPGATAVPSQDRTDVGSGWPGDPLFWTD